MHVNIRHNGGRREGSGENLDCVLRALNTVTGITYEELAAHYQKADGRVPGEPIHFFPDGPHHTFEEFGYRFTLVPESGVTVSELDLDRNKTYLVDFHQENLSHVAAVVGNTLWDNSESDGIEHAVVDGVWEVSRVSNDPGLQAGGFCSGFGCNDPYHVHLFHNTFASFQALVASAARDQETRHQRKEALAQRVNGILASGTPATRNPTISDPLAEAFFNAVDAWIQGPDHSQASWRAMVRDTLGHSMLIHTAKVDGTVFATDSPEAQKIREQAIAQAVATTDDLRQRLLRAENDLNHDRSHSSSLTAAAWPLSKLLEKAHQKLAANSIVKSAQDYFRQGLFKQKSFQEGFTGARKFVAGNPNGRHGLIDGQIDRTGEGWQLPDRPKFGLGPTRILFPGEDPQNPKEWSGSTSHVLYEHIDKKGKVTWLRG